MPALLPGARVVALIWKLLMLKPFGKYDTKGDGVIVYVCVCNVRAGCWHLLRYTKRFCGQEGIEDASSNTRSDMTMCNGLCCFVP